MHRPGPIARTSLAMNAQDWLMLLALSAVWGASYFFGKVAVEDIGPLTVVLGRVSLAAVILYAMIRIRGIEIPRSRADWQGFFVMGLLNSAIPYSLIFWGETRIDSGLAAILTATVPIFTVIVAHFWTVDEKMNPAKAAGIGLGMAGVVVIMGRDLGAIGSGSGLAKLAIIGATISYAFSGIYGRRLKGKTPLILAWGQMCGATVFLLPLVLFVDRPWSSATWTTDAVLSVIALATLCTALAYMIFFRLLATVGATNTSLVTFLIPVSSLILGTLFL
ncbi:MAG: EamA family transporter, partial [Chloroflexota bacterium]|nr:EamA family transporter [Chloroflexota bacterium]